MKFSHLKDHGPIAQGYFKFYFKISITRLKKQLVVFQLTILDIPLLGETRDDHLKGEYHKTQLFLYVKYRSKIQQIEGVISNCSGVLNLNFISYEWSDPNIRDAIL